MSFPGDSERRLTMWEIAPKIMIMPSVGWSLVMSRGPRPEIAVIRFLLPLCLLAAGSEFFSLLYHPDLGFTNVLVQSVITFTSYFLGYYIALVLSKLFLPKDAREFPATTFGKLLIMMGVGSLAFFLILIKVLPMIDFILEFLPVWSVYIIYKGMSMLVVSREKQLLSIGIVSIIVICSPLIVEWILTLFV